jgi:hypothetical protein
MVHCVFASILFVLQASFLCTTQGNNSSDLALHKLATQSGMYAGLDASRAVDGYLYSQPDGRHCSSVDTSDPSYRGNKAFAWWQVDLGDIYTIISVTIYNTYNDPEWKNLYNFTVYTSYTSDVSDAANRMVCQWVKPVPTIFDDTTDVFRVPRNDSYTVNCTRPLVGQFVTIQRVGGSNPGKMTLCEVEVEGNRYYLCQNCQGSCNPNTGCASCDPGFVPPACTRGCDAGTYGINCANKCPQCPDTNQPCDPVTGQCRCPEGSSCKSSTVMYGSNTTTVAVGGIKTTDLPLKASSTSRGQTSGVEQYRQTGATVLGSLVLIVILEMMKRRHC